MSHRHHIGLALSNEDDFTGIPDIYFVNGNLAMVEDARAVGQHVKQRLKTHAGEWDYDKKAGVPWLDQLLGRQYDSALAEDVVKTCIVQTDGVTMITKFSVSFDATTRGVLARSINVKTIYDDEEIQI